MYSRMRVYRCQHWNHLVASNQPTFLEWQKRDSPNQYSPQCLPIPTFRPHLGIDQIASPARIGKLDLVRIRRVCQPMRICSDVVGDDNCRPDWPVRSRWELEVDIWDSASASSQQEGNIPKNVVLQQPHSPQSQGLDNHDNDDKHQDDGQSYDTSRIKGIIPQPTYR